MRGNYCGFVFSYRRTLHFYCVQNFISPEMNSENHIEALLLQLSDCIYDGFGERDRAGRVKMILSSEEHFFLRATFGATVSDDRKSR